MTMVACTYAVLRFTPYRETGEFANVGVIVCAPQAGFFGFQCNHRLGKRLRGFFPELRLDIYRDAVRGMEALLTDLREQLGRKALAADDLHEAIVGRFHELVRTREGLLTFGPAGAILAETPQQALDELHQRMVMRQFAQQPEYHEEVMRKRLATCLRTWQLSAFYHRADIGDHRFHIPVPFVYSVDGQPRKMLRPLDLDRTDTTGIYKHGDQWAIAMRRLRQFNTLPERVVIPVRLPAAEGLLLAAQQVIEDFTGDNVLAIPFDDEAALRLASSVA